MKENEVLIGGRKQVSPLEVILLEADSNYTIVYFKDGSKTLVATTMGKIQKRLPDGHFVRINRHTVINCLYISRYFMGSQYDEIQLQDTSLLKVSRRRRVAARRIFANQ